MPAGSADWQTMLGHNNVEGNMLYQNAYASCHSVDGEGSADLKHPSLFRMTSIRELYSATLVQVIAHGVDGKVGDRHTLMPLFRSSMNDGQIASVANYVRAKFGDVEGSVDASQVTTILNGQVDTPWLIRSARWLAILAIVVAMLAFLVIAWGPGARPSPRTARLMG